MEFVAHIDKDSDAGDSLSLHRQRILAAQIKDSELGEDEVLLPSADTFDNSVENSVFANESALMEMDEVITQIQQWRNRASKSNEEDDNEQAESQHPSTYHSEAYDRIFKTENGPESDGETGYTPRSPREKQQYAPDEEMIAKLQSLQALIKESKSTDSVTLHQRHVLEYQALMAVLKERFGDKLNALQQSAGDVDDSCSDDDDDEGSSVNNNCRQVKSGTSNARNNNNDEEEGQSGDGSGGISARATSAGARRGEAGGAHSHSNLDREFRTIDFEVREGNYELNRQKENEVIQQGADLQLDVATLADALRDFTSDLDRLLLG